MNMPASSPLAGLPPFDQICLVVPDMQAALALYEPLFGPFMVLENGPFESVCRGRKAMVDMIVAFGRSGDIEIELVQPLSGPLPHREFLDAGRSGIQHLRYSVEDLRGWQRKLEAAGYEEVWAGSYPATPGTRAICWVYLQRAGDPVLVELVEFGS
jgi:catechol 2,3-dioxygenase-like lactoylglutathione lyase family enzyme